MGVSLTFIVIIRWISSDAFGQNEFKMKCFSNNELPDIHIIYRY